MDNEWLLESVTILSCNFFVVLSFFILSSGFRWVADTYCGYLDFLTMYQKALISFVWCLVPLVSIFVSVTSPSSGKFGLFISEQGKLVSPRTQNFVQSSFLEENTLLKENDIPSNVEITAARSRTTLLNTTPPTTSNLRLQDNMQEMSSAVSKNSLLKSLHLFASRDSLAEIRLKHSEKRLAEFVSSLLKSDTTVASNMERHRSSVSGPEITQENHGNVAGASKNGTINESTLSSQDLSGTKSLTASDKSLPSSNTQEKSARAIRTYLCNLVRYVSTVASTINESSAEESEFAPRNQSTSEVKKNMTSSQPKSIDNPRIQTGSLQLPSALRPESVKRQDNQLKVRIVKAVAYPHTVLLKPNATKQRDQNAESDKSTKAKDLKVSSNVSFNTTEPNEINTLMTANASFKFGTLRNGHLRKPLKPTDADKTDTDSRDSTSSGNTICEPGKFGEGCLQLCGHCEGGDINCDPENGLCRAGCEFGWISPRCTVPCDTGTWGDRCYGCGRCEGGGAQCNRTNGICMKGCEVGWYNKRCQLQCGHCIEGFGACDEDKGECFGGCMPGWTGATCSTPCLPMRWGPDCSRLCGQCAEDSCNSSDGRCAKGCALGWKDPHCMTPCNGNSYGANCSQTCGMCLIVNGNSEFLRCHRETGVCDGGCQPGWQGEKCQTQCPNGTYGMNCSGQCSCPGEPKCTCDPRTGECTSGLCAVQSLASETYFGGMVAALTVLAVLVLIGSIIGAAIWFWKKRHPSQPPALDLPPRKKDLDILAADGAP